MGELLNSHWESKLFQPLKIGNGKIELKHRVIHAPLTRNRGTPLSDSTPENPNRVWLPNEHVLEYYTQRATVGGLMISEGLPPSLEGNCMPGVPGLFIKEQAQEWKKVVDAVHAKGAYIYAQLWHSGRANIPQLTGTPIVAPSSVPWDDPNECFAYPPPHTSTQVKLAEFPPIELTKEHITRTIDDYCESARMAMEIGFDGVELHGGNGYLPEQFLSSNSNKRTDEYGGTPEKRCTFVIELMEKLAKVVGEENLAIRLSPFGLFNQARSQQRVETWSQLCRELKSRHPTLSYVSFIEPRYEQIFSEAEKQSFLDSWGLPDVDLSLFRTIWGDTPFFSAGGFDDKNSWGVVESGKYDGLLYGRYFISNPDLVTRLRDGLPLAAYDRSRFYGPFPEPTIGYTDYPVYQNRAK
ncbi:12-oxophytodienoate reductase [Pochonia chlamydosporia 170]|uniref:12-oxophytodienoate reductase n=1 Tax=Pochonia chlamydosporia 170 TaxID=1380566 RepID=A0A179FHJ2_METCM|nr:12-oxophytodienoate reductase [Pochonia chlamydosporia 170]OAQ65016.2 12-oxophytodienoate reductase [Pochonia chlamydosporia 170]